MENNSLKKFNQVLWQVGIDECLYSDRYFIDVFGLRQGSLDHLLDNVLSMSVRRIKHFGPKAGLLTLNQVAGLSSVKISFVSNFNQLVVALAPSSLVGGKSEIWIAVLTVLSDYFAVVELILDEEFLRILQASINIYFS